MGDLGFSLDVIKGPLAITDELVVVVPKVQLVVVVVEAVGLVSVAVVYALAAVVVVTVAVVIPLSVCDDAVDVIGVEQGLLQEVVEGAGHSRLWFNVENKSELALDARSSPLSLSHKYPLPELEWVLTSLSPPSRHPDRWSENSSVLSLYGLCTEELSLNRWFRAGDKGLQGC